MQKQQIFHNGDCKFCGKKFTNIVRVRSTIIKPFSPRPRHQIETWRDVCDRDFCSENCFHEYNKLTKQDMFFPENSKKQEDLFEQQKKRKMPDSPFKEDQEKYENFQRTKWLKKILIEEEKKKKKNSNFEEEEEEKE